MFLSLSLGTLTMAGVAPNGREFQVNTYTTSHQGFHALAMNGDGDFVVAWESVGQDGSSSGIFARRYGSSGSAVGTEFQVNTYTTFHQGNPVVGIDGSGDFMVAWGSSGQDGSSGGIFAQRFDSSGSAVGAEFQVNTYTSDSQSMPAVGMDGDGDFVVAWESDGQDGSSGGIFAQRYDSSGTAVGAEFQVNTYTSNWQSYPAVGMSGDGDFVVAWESSDQDGSWEGIFAQRYDSSGTAVGAEFQVNTYTTSPQLLPAVGMDGDGDFVVTWVGDYQDGDWWGIFGQRFDSSGGAVGAAFQVNTYTTDRQRFPAVGMDDDGDFVVAWESVGQDGSGYGIFGQRVLINGPALTSPVPAGTVDCSSPALARPTFTWETGDYDRFKVFMGSSRGFEKRTRVTSGDRKIRTGSWMPGKKKWKRACNKAINQAADPNSPVMYVAVRGVDRDLRKKDPLRKLFSFVVRTEVQP